MCQQKEEKRNLAVKRWKQNSQPCSHKIETEPSILAVDLCAIDVDKVSVLSDARSAVDQLQQTLQSLQQDEQNIIDAAKKAEEDIDNVLDHFLGQVIRMISRKKCHMKEQVILFLVLQIYMLLTVQYLKNRKLELAATHISVLIRYFAIIEMY